MSEILVVLKDITPLRYLLKIFAILEKYQPVYIAGEGVAHEKLSALNIAHQVRLPNQISNFDALVVGCSTNSVLETKILRLSGGELLSIGVCDIRGAHNRHGGVFADHYLVPNQWVADGISNVDSTIIGDINVLPFLQPSHEMRQTVSNWLGRSKMLTVIAQQDLDQILIAAEYVRRDADCKLLLGLHPDTNKWPDRDVVMRIVSSLSGRAIITSSLIEGANTLELLACVEQERAIVMTAFSGGATTAAAWGYRVVVADGKQIRANYQKECGFGNNELPLVDLINSPVISLEDIPDNLFKLQYPTKAFVDKKLKALDAVHAANTLVDFFE